MQVSAARENILKKIRKALTQTTPLPFPASEGTSTVFKPGLQELEIEFGEQFSKLLGKFVYCADTEELETQLSTIISHNKWEKIFFKENEVRSIFSNSFLGKSSYPDLATGGAHALSFETHHPRGGIVARLGAAILAAGGAADVGTLEPAYVRASQAELARRS